MSNDIDTIGINVDSLPKFNVLDEKNWWDDKSDIAKFCLAYAVRAEVVTGASSTATSPTKWAVGNFDKDGEIRGVLRVIYPDSDTPGRLMEHLINEGLTLVHARVVTEQAGPAELLS